MSLNARIRQIATQAVKGYISTLTNITQNNTSNSAGNVQLGTVSAFDGTNYTVTFADGTTQEVPPGGLKPITTGDAVLIGGGLIVG
jgi:hypothetical protein